MELNTKQEFLEAKQEREMLVQQVKGMFSEHVPKSHIAKHFGLEVYEVTKILSGEPIDMISMFLFKKYKDIAVDIYWGMKLSGKTLLQMANKHNLKTWVARELLKCFEKSLSERITKKPNTNSDD